MYSIFGSNKSYGITQNPVTKDFMIIMDNYLLDDLIDNIFYKSGNKILDYFLRNTQINDYSIEGMMEFVPYDRFCDKEFNATSNSYKATWIDGNIQNWNIKEMNFERSGLRTVILKKT